jgi:hypothetical protein
MDYLEEFLERVLPSEGTYCIAVFLGGGDRVSHIWKPTLGGLADAIRVNDANGHTVYHACATFKQDAGGKLYRRIENVKFLRSLWLDVDYGNTHKKPSPYKDKDEAAQAVAALSGSINLPDPVLIDSGYGLHCYWPMAENVDRIRWQKLADYFRGVCIGHELAADHSLTGNPAVILRPIGTHNRKHGQERLVRCL